MVIVHAYVSRNGYIVADLPFRYNNGDDTPITAREFVLEAQDDDTYEQLKGKVADIIEKEKQDYGEYPTGQPGLVPCITID